MIASALTNRLAQKMDYMREEQRILMELLQQATGKKRIAFTADQRRRLAIKGRELTAKERKACCHIVRPETILAWYRQLGARKYDSSGTRNVGRPRKADEIRKLVLRLANENLGWGHTKIRDALRGLKIEIGRTTVANILAEEGLEPAPERTKRKTWAAFLKSHWSTLYACDFFSVETLGTFGTVRHMVFFVIELKTRIVHVAGVRANPDEAWMIQIVRNLCDPTDGFLRGAKFLVHDRDPLFTKQWKLLLTRSGISSVAIPAQSPNCNPHAERFIKSVRNECLDHFIVFGEAHLRHLVREYVAHYNAERYHQVLGGKLLTETAVASNDNSSTGVVKARSRLDGTLNFYHREAA
ncbi:MAG: integrase core domain-containing protein [Myxococcales bacterium]|nr:integrase core domain-containing protein [Myxococcales bacterium]